MPTRVFLVDDHTVLRAGLRMLLEEEPDISIVGEAEDAESALAHVSAAAPQVIVLDITLPGITGIDAIAGLVERCPNAAIVLLTMHENTFLVKQAMQRGARGFVLKSSADREIVAAIREVTAGRVYLDSTLATKFVSELSPEDSRSGAGDAKLTAREKQVVEFVVRGYSNKETAEGLSIAVKTVESHRRRIMDRLGLRSRAELVHYAIQERILDVEPDSPTPGADPRSTA